MLGLSLPSRCKARLSIPSQDTTGTRQLFPILYTAHISLLTPLTPSPCVLPPGLLLDCILHTGDLS